MIMPLSHPLEKRCCFSLSMSYLQTWLLPAGFGDALPADTQIYVVSFHASVCVRCLLGTFLFQCSQIHKAPVFAAPQEFAGSVKSLGAPCRSWLVLALCIICKQGQRADGIKFFCKVACPAPASVSCQQLQCVNHKPGCCYFSGCSFYGDELLYNIQILLKLSSG